MAGNRFSSSMTVITAILLAAFGISQSPAEDPLVVPAADVLKKMRQSLAGIRSVQYDFQHVSKGRDRNGMETTRTTDVTFAWSEGKFYAQNQLDSQPPIFEHLAFDGELYQRLDAGRMRLTVDTEIPKIPYVALQPILLPYLFVPRGDGRLELETFQREDSWQDITAKAASGEPRAIAGHPCQVLKFATTVEPGKEIHWEICAAADLDFFPIQQSNHGSAGGRRTESTLSVKKFADLKTPRGRVIFPLEVEVVSLNANGEKIQAATTKVYETSVKVNEPIPLETFWLKRLKPIKTRFLGNLTDEQEQRYEKGPLK